MRLIFGGIITVRFPKVIISCVIYFIKPYVINLEDLIRVALSNHSKLVKLIAFATPYVVGVSS